MEVCSNCDKSLDDTKIEPSTCDHKFHVFCFLVHSSDLLCPICADVREKIRQELDNFISGLCKQEEEPHNCAILEKEYKRLCRLYKVTP